MNIGAHLVRDALIGALDVAVVLTNDSDLIEPIRIAVVEAKRRVGLLVPVKYPNLGLAAAASFHLHIRPGHLARAQFPPDVVLLDGTTVAKPPSWG